MNEVFLMGKIITEIEFKFIINSKTNKSIATFMLETFDKQVIYIKAYNDLADFVYSIFKSKDKVLIYGYLSKNSVAIRYISLLFSINMI